MVGWWLCTVSVGKVGGCVQISLGNVVAVSELVSAGKGGGCVQVA